MPLGLTSGSAGVLVYAGFALENGNAKQRQAQRGGCVNSSLVTILNMLCALIKREDGQDLVEYGLVVALVAFGAILGLQHLGGMVSLLYSAISSTMLAAT